jgi:hypothetical protein
VVLTHASYFFLFHQCRLLQFAEVLRNQSDIKAIQYRISFHVPKTVRVPSSTKIELTKAEVIVIQTIFFSSQGQISERKKMGLQGERGNDSALFFLLQYAISLRSVIGPG